MRKSVCAAIGFWMALGGPSLAQTLAAGPAEPPPADYIAREYVDSNGCVFQRAGVSGAVIWLPRLTGDNVQVCGKVPSLGVVQGAAESTPKVVAVQKDPAKTSKVKVKSRGRMARPKAITLDQTITLDASETHCLARTGSVQRYLLSDGRRVTKCGPVAKDAVAFLNGLAMPGLHVAGQTAPGKMAAPGAAPTSYRVIWTNGDLRDVAAPDARRKWVQIGAFANPANATAALAGLHALGLPAAHLPMSGAQNLDAVLAGPFLTAAEVDLALGRLRKAGFATAFVRG